MDYGFDVIEEVRITEDSQNKDILSNTGKQSLLCNNFNCNISIKILNHYVIHLKLI